MQISDIRSFHKRKSKKRVGRGEGSGHGKTSCRGNKGENSRTGSKFYVGFQGGQVPLMRKIPKRGFNAYKKNMQVVNVGEIEHHCTAQATITPEVLKEKGLINSLGKPVKILAEGTLTKKFTFEKLTYSAKAREKITAVGGSILGK